ncbi:unnamed protein product [Sympodiomycopsis kandeliae]
MTTSPPRTGKATQDVRDSDNASILSLPSRIASDFGRGYLVSFARSSVLALFSRLSVGLLTIKDVDGSVSHFGDKSLVTIPSSASPSSPSQDTQSVLAELIVNSDAFWIRMFFGADLGFSEAFMANEVDTPNLGACFDLFIHNRAALSELDLGLASRVTGWIQGQLNKRYANTKGGSLKNIGAHYDISNSMYQRFLSRDMTYSCAVYRDLDADIAPPIPLAAASSLNRLGTRQMPNSQGHDSGLGSPGSEISSGMDELEEAQIRKLRLHITRCQIQPGDRVLEIGTGWGSLAMETCKMVPDVTIDSLTLSKEQKSLAEARIKEAGLDSQIRVHLLDYRDMPEEWADSFDRVVSIEMLEAVGIEFLSTYFRCIHRVLKANTGTAVFQCITMPESRFEAYVKGVDFIKKYIFPGGVLPSVQSLVNGMAEGSNGTMVLQAVDSIGPHYARTLREWRQRFENAFEGKGGIRESLLRESDAIRSLSAEKREAEVDVFRRKWLYYFIYCERGFAENQIGDHILTFARVGAPLQPVSFGAA